MNLAKEFRYKELRYRTERGFHNAFARFNMFGAIVTWFGTDHEWVIRVRTDKLPKRGQS